MADEELVKKMVRALLQSGALSLSQLQMEYKELTGELVPYKQLGFTTLDELLHNMPSVVRLDKSQSGEVVCHATADKEMAQIAKLAARQWTAKRTGRPQVVNCQMRVKPAAPLELKAKPRTSLRQPEHRGRLGRGGSRGGGHGDNHSGTIRDSQADGRGSRHHNTPSNTSTKKAESLISRPDKRMTLPSRFQKEVHAHLSRNPPPSTVSCNINEITTPAKPRTSHPAPYSPKLVQSRLKEVLHKHSNGLWASKLPHLYREHYKQDLPSEALKDLEHWTHICTIEKPHSSKPQELLLYPAKESLQPSTTPQTQDKTPTQRPSATSKPITPASPKDLSPDLKMKLEELLLKYSSGLWAHALPKLYQDTYKCKLPDFVLDHLTLLSDICTIDYPMPDNPKRAILYAKVVEDENRNQPCLDETRTKETTGRRPSSSQAVPPLVIPKEEYPSVLVVEASDTNSVVLRYIGEGYSKAQEKLEDEMREFYGQNTSRNPLTSPSPGQLAAVRAEEEEEILRAQVREVISDKVKVYYVDHGFSEVLSRNKLLELHQKFYRLPFQATTCKLAGLECFSQEQEVLKRFESMACGKILLAEILEREDPLVVLYDTSQDDDININAACLKALQEKSLESPLKVNSAYMNVSVTSVCSNGTIYCQLPSRGLTKLNQVLEKAEKYFHSQVTSESLVARPFCGKCCLARYKGKWSRVEITNLHGSRVLDIFFVDVGVQASVEVTELREIPPPLLRDLISTPPQALKCCLAELPVRLGSWTPDAIQWLRDTVLHSTDCSLKISKVDETKHLAHVFLFTSKNFHDTSVSLNQKLADSDLWSHQKDVFLSSKGPSKLLSSPAAPSSTLVHSPNTEAGNKAPQSLKRLLGQNVPPGSPPKDLTLPPPLDLPETGQNMDVFVSVACHPGHFVLQPWQDMYKLVVLMGEMILHYNKTEEKPYQVKKNQVCAAKVENNWYRVLVKGLLNNGLVSVFQLDYGKHELVNATQLRPLCQDFCQLPFQAITAQLAGLKPRQWSEEASIVFRNHVEKKPFVAQLESVHEASQAWDRKVVIYLVDTSQEERDIWLHDIMAEFTEEQSNAV